MRCMEVQGTSFACESLSHQPGSPLLCAQVRNSQNPCLHVANQDHQKWFIMNVVVHCFTFSSWISVRSLYCIMCYFTYVLYKLHTVSGGQRSEVVKPFDPPKHCAWSRSKHFGEISWTWTPSAVQIHPASNSQASLSLSLSRWEVVSIR